MRHQRITLPALAALAALATFAPTTAHADPYKWCAVYGGDAGGASNCGFTTIEQCRATVSGIGGSCEPNQSYTGDREPDRPRKRKTTKRVRD